MSSNGEHREYLERELASVGIKPDIARTDGGHMRVRWTHGGKLRSILTSWTPSDHRSTLNARSRIRHILREDGIFDQERERPAPLQRALCIPVGRDPNTVRIERLEQDVNTLLDIVAELSAKLGLPIHTEPVSVVSAAAYAKPAEPKKPKEAKPPKAPGEDKRCTKSKRHELLLCIEYQPTPVTEIMRRAGNRTAGAISVALTNLKKRGLVENTGRGMWQKVQPVNGANGHHA